MNQIKKILLLFVILCFAVVGNNLILIPYYNSNALFGSYTQKTQRAATINDNKVILVGGSATNLGFDCNTFEALSKTPAVNLALSADVPLRVYLKAAENIAQPRDTIILTLEYGFYSEDFQEVNEIYVDMVEIDPSVKCSEGFWGNIEYGYTRFLRSFTKANDCLVFLAKNLIGTEKTIYIANSVNEYGDFVLHQGRKATYQRSTSVAEFGYNTEVFDQLSAYIDKMKSNDVTVYISYPPMDGKQYTNYEKYFSDAQAEIQKHLGQNNIIGSPFDFIYEEDCFFDTCYHLRFEKREQYTTELYEKLQAMNHIP